jgi:hypothetical protein
MHTIFWLENLKGGDHSEDLGIDGSIISPGNVVGRCELGVSGSVAGPF